MKNDKKIFIIIEISLAMAVIAMVLLMVRENTDTDIDRISVIVEDSDDSSWAAYKYGLKMASKDYGVSLSVVNTGQNLTVEEELELIEDEVAGGADAVIVQSLSRERDRKLEELLPHSLPVMLIGAALSDENSTLYPVTGEDSYAMGVDLAEALLEDYNGSLEGKQIGLIASKGQTIVQKERLRGFREKIASAGGEIAWFVNDNAQSEHMVSLEEQSKVNIVIALDNNALVLSGKTAAENNLHGAVVYGIGHSREAFYYLDIGVVNALVVPDTFSAGYQSLGELAKNRKRMFAKPVGQIVGYEVVRRDCLFTEEIQDILFTMSQ